MKKRICSILINLIFISGIAASQSMAQVSLPPLGVTLALDKAVYVLNVDPIGVSITLSDIIGADFITSLGFADEEFHLFLTFIGPDGERIIAPELAGHSSENPPPQVVVVDGALLQAEAVELIPTGYIVTVTLPNAYAYYSLTKVGNYCVKAEIPMRTYNSIFQTVNGIDFAKLENFGFAGKLISNTVCFWITDDNDGDSYYAPKIDPRSDLFKKLVEDCDDYNILVNPGRPEIQNNLIDDDCNPASRDSNNSLKPKVESASVKKGIGQSPHRFSFRGSFEVDSASGSGGLDPQTQDVEVVFGQVSKIISGTFFFRDAENQGWQFNGPLGGITQVNIKDNNNIQVKGSGVGLSGIVCDDPNNPTHFSLRIGINKGSIGIPLDAKCTFKQKRTGGKGK